MEYPKIFLKRNKIASILRKHPWVFSGAIRDYDNVSKSLKDGDIVEIFDDSSNFLAIGYFSKATIAARVLSYIKEDINQQFWIERIKNAFELRLELGLVGSNSTSAYRLIHGEGDNIPGLIIDVYNKNAVVQAHTSGIAKHLNLISNALKELGLVESVYSKSELTLHVKDKEAIYKDGYLYGNVEVPQLIKEGNLKFEVDWINGQKTGFFLDQRDNRELLKRYCSKKKILNTFCYSGGFSLYALAGGAEIVHSVDSSQRAIDHCERNLRLNEYDPEQHLCFTMDTLKFLNSANDLYDIIVLDPPAYAKNIKAKHRATQAYKRLNSIALKKLNKSGLLFTFSCSQAIHKKLFEDTIRAAAIENGRSIRVLHHLSQGADHPVNIYHPEGEYLKGLVLVVD